MKDTPSGLKQYMKPQTRAKLGNLPTTHRNCINALEALK